MKSKIISLLLMSLFFISAQAEEVTAQFLEYTSSQNLSLLKDEKSSTGITLNDEVIEINAQNVKGLYFKWELYPENGLEVLTENETLTAETDFLQEYLQFEDTQSGTITIKINGNAKLTELSLLSLGTLPNEVHNWSPPCDKADILILPTHADDEHLFMGGVMPTYTERGDIKIQVAYMVNHKTQPYREQELLNGLWEAGVRNYPIIPQFPDIYSDSLEHAKTIYSEQEIIDYELMLLEQFKPQVIVAHDLDGEYGHGAHMLFAETIIKAIEISEYKPKKLYLHLYEENTISMDMSIPLEKFGGRTAFEVAEDAFALHYSQTPYFSVSESYLDVRAFGLYFTTVGYDSSNDMFENIISYNEQERIEEKRLEEERLAEEARLEQERIEAEKLAEEQRLEQEREEARIAQEQSDKNKLIAISFTVILLIIIIIIVIKTKKYNRKH